MFTLLSLSYEWTVNTFYGLIGKIKYGGWLSLNMEDNCQLKLKCDFHCKSDFELLFNFVNKGISIWKWSSPGIMSFKFENCLLMHS